MHILVLDTIHGGDAIGRAFAARGCTVDTVDIYRNGGSVPAGEALNRSYDLVVAPVHLDPDHPLLVNQRMRVVTHHEVVRQLLGTDLPCPFIEITGARGKTTTAHALASVLPGPGILHTSSGTFRFPEKEFLSRSSITPASLLSAASLARERGGWLVAEESLGVTGAGTLAIITSDLDYAFAAKKKSALAQKIASAARSPRVLVAGDAFGRDLPNAVHVGDLVSCTGEICTVSWENRTVRFANPLLLLDAYRTPLSLAAAAAALLGFDPSPLSSFEAIPGRMAVSRRDGIVVVDNAGSGTCLSTVVDAVRYARTLTGENVPVTLVIGRDAGDGAVCEGFPPEEILAAINAAKPDRVVWVGPGFPGTLDNARFIGCAETLEEGSSLAKKNTGKGSLVLAVKTWR